MAQSMLVCEVFRCSRRAEMYLYVDHAKGIADLPDTLLAGVGELTSVMVLKLTEDRYLARADVLKVMAAIAEQGYYLQMPPVDWQPGTTGAAEMKDA